MTNFFNLHFFIRLSLAASTENLMIVLIIVFLFLNDVRDKWIAATLLPSYAHANVTVRLVAWRVENSTMLAICGGWTKLVLFLFSLTLQISTISSIQKKLRRRFANFFMSRVVCLAERAVLALKCLVVFVAYGWERIKHPLGLLFWDDWKITMMLFAVKLLYSFDTSTLFSFLRFLYRIWWNVIFIIAVIIYERLVHVSIRWRSVKWRHILIGINLVVKHV